MAFLVHKQRRLKAARNLNFCVENPGTGFKNPSGKMAAVLGGLTLWRKHRFFPFSFRSVTLRLCSTPLGCPICRSRCAMEVELDRCRNSPSLTSPLDHRKLLLLLLFYSPPRPNCYFTLFAHCTVRSATPQTTLWGGPGPRLEPGTGDPDHF